MNDAQTRTFVLVHGAWRGSWLWKRVRDKLSAKGHRVFTPALTGLGERSHLLSRYVGLETHIRRRCPICVSCPTRMSSSSHLSRTRQKNMIFFKDMNNRSASAGLLIAIP